MDPAGGRLANGINAAECSSLSFKYAVCWPNLQECVSVRASVLVLTWLFMSQKQQTCSTQAHAVAYTGLYINAIIGT